MESNKRLEELKSKETLTDKEMFELMSLSPPRMFSALPNMLTLGVVDIDKAFNNFKEGPERSKNALNNGCYLEVISLRLQHSDFWLRMFWVAKNKKGKIFDSDDRRTFGNLVNDCKQLGFNNELITRLVEFNDHRINAIHKYLLGATEYTELREVCEKSSGLDGEVGEYVRKEIGIPIF